MLHVKIINILYKKPFGLWKSFLYRIQAESKEFSPCNAGMTLALKDIFFILVTDNGFVCDFGHKMRLIWVPILFSFLCTVFFFFGIEPSLNCSIFFVFSVFFGIYIVRHLKDGTPPNTVVKLRPSMIMWVK